MLRPAALALSLLIAAATTAVQAAPAPAAPASDAAPPPAAATAEPLAGRTLRIGTREAPPFAMKQEDGVWTGISIDLLAGLARRLGVHYDLVETSLAGMIDDVADGRLDASIAAMTVTREREERIDFTHPFYRSSLAVAVPAQGHGTLLNVLQALASSDFLVTMGLLVGLIFVVGALAWSAERRSNSGQFEPDARRGLFSGFWWAAVTMTTVGYGDKAPVTALGRVLAMVWMLAAIMLTALVTAQLAAALTAGRIASRVNTVADLARVRVGYVEGAASLAALQRLGVRPGPYSTVDAGLAAVAAGDLDAFVHDEPILAWRIQRIGGVVIAPLHFAPQDYALVLPQNSLRREEINDSLLDELASDEWIAIQRRYLGELQ